MPTIAEYQEIKATKLAQALHAHDITAHEAETFDETQWQTVSLAARVRPPKTSIPITIQKLRDLEAQDRALEVAREFFYDESPHIHLVAAPRTEKDADSTR